MVPDDDSTGSERTLSIASDLPLIPSHEDLAQRSVYAGLGPFYAIERFVALAVRVVIFIGMMGLGLIVAAQVFLRYVLAAPILGIQELAPLFALWAYFAGMVYATREREHVVGGILTLVVRRVRTMLFLRLISSLLCIVTCGTLLYFAVGHFEWTISLGRESPYMRWPRALWGASMLSGFTLMIFYFVLQLVVEVRAFIQPSRIAVNRG